MDEVSVWMGDHREINVFLNHDYLVFSKGRTRSAHDYKTWTPYARNNIYKLSFWIRYINTWDDCSDDHTKFAYLIDKNKSFARPSRAFF